MGELLKNSGEFMLARYEEVANSTLKFKDDKDKNICLAVVSLIPRLADFCPERFMAEHFGSCMEHLLKMAGPKMWNSASDQGVVFLALKGIVEALHRHNETKELSGWLPKIVERLSETISGQKKERKDSPCKEALECEGSLAEAFGQDWKDYAEDLLVPSVLTGVSDALAETLHKTVEALPGMAEQARELLLNALALVLVGQPFRSDAAENTLRQLRTEVVKINTLEEHESLVITALHILSTFDFGDCSLLTFVSNHIIKLVRKNQDWKVRKAAAKTCCLVLRRHSETAEKEKGEPPTLVRPIPDILQQLVQTAVSDRDGSVRWTIFDLFLGSQSLDRALAQPSCLVQLFPGLGDSNLAVRAMAIRLIGRLGVHEPELVEPVLGALLGQLLQQLEFSPVGEFRQDSARLLGMLIESAPYVVLSHSSLEQICKVLTCLLEDEGNKASNRLLLPQTAAVPEGVHWTAGNGVITTVLETAGTLAEHASRHLVDAGIMDKLCSLVVDAIRDKDCQNKQVQAVKTLGKIVANTGDVVHSYHKAPWLLPQLLDMLQVDDPSVRREVVKLMGIICALDPSMHKKIQAKASGEGRLELEGVRPIRRGQDPGLSESTSYDRSRVLGWGGSSLDTNAVELLPAPGIAPNSEESYSIIAMNALLRILKQPAMVMYHRDVVRTLGTITNSLSMSSVPYLKKLIPKWCKAIDSGDTELKVYILEQFIRLVKVVKQHMRRFLEQIMNVVEGLWVPSCSKKLLLSMLKLITELAGVCRDDMKRHLCWLAPRLILVLETSELKVLESALPSISVFGNALQGYFHHLLPAIWSLLSPHRVSKVPVRVQRDVLKCIRALLPHLHVPELGAGLMLPIISLIQNTNQSQKLMGEVMDIVCAMAMTVGPDGKVFFDSIKEAMAQQGIEHCQFECLTGYLQQSDAAPCDPDMPWDVGATWREDYEPAVPEPPDDTPGASPQRFNLDERDMGVAWDTAHRYTKDDWAEWMRQLSLRLLSSSPSPALRACKEFAQMIPGMAKDLFPASFISCWSELSDSMQQQLVRSLEAALASPTIPPEIITSLLNLAELMEHDRSQLPLDTRTLGALASKCQAFAKALHYKEVEFQESPKTAVEAILAIYSQLRQPEAADGMLKYAREHLQMELRESWYEKLHKWDKAKEQYERKMQVAHSGTLAHVDATLGCMRCYGALWEWENLSDLCGQQWEKSDPFVRKEIVPLVAQAAWHMGHWEDMATFLEAAEPQKDTPDAATRAFLQSVSAVQSENYEGAWSNIDRARDLLSADLAALAGESYERAYECMVRLQQLTELEEAIRYKLADLFADGDLRRHQIRAAWQSRLEGVQHRCEVWESLLSVRSLVVPMHEDKDTWIKFATLCGKQGRLEHAKRVLVNLLGYNPEHLSLGDRGYASQSGMPDVMYAYIKHLHASGKRQDAHDRLQDLICNELDPVSGEEEPGSHALEVLDNASSSGETSGSYSRLLGHAYIKLAKWKHGLANKLDESTVKVMIMMVDKATQHAPDWPKVWRQLAVYHLAAVEHLSVLGAREQLRQHVAPAVKGFFQSLRLSQDDAHWMDYGDGPSKDTYQDILRLLTLWFTYGNAPNVVDELNEGFRTVRIETWLVVVPQLIARIHMKSTHIQKLIHMLLLTIGQAHPQALLYPLLVGCHSSSENRRASAHHVLHSMRNFAPDMVADTELVSQHLVEIAVLWDEKWHEGLEEASRLYFADGDAQAMIDMMMPLHEMLNSRDPRTNSERQFINNYGLQLREAYQLLRNYEATKLDTALQRAWDTYYHVFRKINKDLHNMSVLQLIDVAPELLDRCMDVAVPGTYSAFAKQQVCIMRVVPEIQIIKSKQRPRKLRIQGTDGHDYMFLLKGHEDLRQDERVMQLLRLVNTILASDYDTAHRELSIARYAVTPLSPNVGLIGWVPNCDTMHSLIREYREARAIPINLEHQLMKNFAPNYDNLSLIQKVEVFEHALDSTPGDDLKKVMWHKSRNSEQWLNHRTNYIRSCAVMSMVGYLLGLGDRHPSNLMLDRYTGKLLHIDFGDCFEASMNRDKFPEKVPFRLTRMMIKAMEVSGIEGTFRTTCELAMRVLRNEKQSLMAMLEAFVHDPLINWRLALNHTEGGAGAAGAGPALGAGGLEGAGEAGEDDVGPAVRRDVRERELLNAYNKPGDAHEILNARAIQVIERIQAKLSGRDFGPQTSDKVDKQVDRLIQEATSHSNLCQAYIGWCPFW
ncbi:unnamed protein product [Ostreobium quekettii]|uniref:Serine/threonine-protein kinase TOR n=1 Tax=Ostreobium quekettii TaxID=121088 RepID=A0A8S1J6S9_9CHLO|nr:unnamed protein product [Ostreobium quekettii]|eukprot:evm.model.scf_73.12 EVM.evm.TU.scf_73.12   scf_73:97195-114381(-)